MNKFSQFCLGLLVLCGVVGLGWSFYSINMAPHPLIKSCFQVLAKHCVNTKSFALRNARFVVNENGASLIIAYDIDKEEGGILRTEAVFPLKQDPAKPSNNIGVCPFEDESLIIDRLQLAGEADIPITPPLHGIKTPLLVHTPVGIISGYKDGVPIGPKSVTLYDCAWHFLRYSDEVAAK